MRLAFTADLHWGIRPAGDEATRQLIGFLSAKLPDLLVVAGDVGAGNEFAECLTQLAALDCPKALIPGNHDIWVAADDPRGDSLALYEEYLPGLCKQQAIHYLDSGPLFFPDANLALVGSINWYDYSWALEALRRDFPGDEERLRSKQFTRGRHNDARYVRWLLDDGQFTARVAARLEQHLEEAFATASDTIVVTHHPAWQGLGFPRPETPVTLDSLLWDAFSGNRTVEALLHRHNERIPFVFCGHTHRERESTLGRTRGLNVGGDYHFKRLLLLDWPAGNIEAFTFGVQ